MHPSSNSVTKLNQPSHPTPVKKANKLTPENSKVTDAQKDNISNYCTDIVKMREDSTSALPLLSNMWSIYCWVKALVGCTWFNATSSSKFCAVILLSPLLQTKKFLSFVTAPPTDWRWCHKFFGVNNAPRPIWIKSLNSVAQHSADTLRHPLCAVIHFLQRNWSGHRWCHLNTGLPFRRCFVAPVHDRADQPHHHNSNKWTGYGKLSVLGLHWGDWQVFDIHWRLPPPSHLSLSPLKRHVWV